MIRVAIGLGRIRVDIGLDKGLDRIQIYIGLGGIIRLQRKIQIIVIYINNCRYSSKTNYVPRKLSENRFEITKGMYYTET